MEVECQDRLAGDLPSVNGAPAKIKQVLSTWVSNAMNAMADAPGRHRSARNFLELGTFEEFSSANLPVASNVVTE